MNTMFICGAFYQFPAGIERIDQFIEYINSQRNKFIPLYRFENDNCVYPYFIREETKVVYVNFSLIPEIEEAEIQVLDKEEYEERLLDCVNNVCRYCVNFEDDSYENDLEGYRGKINLDGECFWRQEI